MTTSSTSCSQSHAAINRKWSGLLYKLTPLKVVLSFDLHIGHNYSQHLLMNIDSRYLIGHISSWPGAESVLRLP